MRKVLGFLMLLGVVAGGIAFAAVTTGTFGDQNSSKAYRMSVDSDGVVATASDTKVMVASTATPVASLQVGGAGTAITGSSIGALDAWFANDVQVDGVIYDAAIYSATTNSTAGRTVCVSPQGKFYTSAAACP